MNDTVFALIRESLFPGQKIIIPDKIDWEDVYMEMKEQAIAALPFHWLREHPLSDDKVYNDWIKTCNKQQNRWVRLMGAQTCLVSLLDRHHIPFVIIKGAAAAWPTRIPIYVLQGTLIFWSGAVIMKRPLCCWRRMASN